MRLTSAAVVLLVLAGSSVGAELNPAAAPAPAPAAPAGPMAAPAPAAPKAWEIAADRQPVERKELEGGLIVEDFVVGKGVEIAAEAALLINYHGTLKSNGNVFDSSFQRGQPALLSLKEVIPGWQKGIPGIRVGGLRRLTIPAAMAYGATERPGIPANSDLVFVVQAEAGYSFEDVKAGTGDEIWGPAIIVGKSTIKDETGKVVFESKDPYVWIPGEMFGVSQGMVGAKVGGVRKVSVSGRFAEIPQGLPSPIKVDPNALLLTVETEVLQVRNLTPQPVPVVPVPAPTPAPAPAAPATPATPAAPAGN